ncbi:hypothetical protein F4604DRAFT_1672957 [Suillus subluteus]|nr:hypothetical protein F4604DRAFT_1672957 [Suillus subluteus]
MSSLCSQLVLALLTRDEVGQTTSFFGAAPSRGALLPTESKYGSVIGIDLRITRSSFCWWQRQGHPLNVLTDHFLRTSESTMILTKEFVLALQVHASVGTTRYRALGIFLQRYMRILASQYYSAYRDIVAQARPFFSDNSDAISSDELSAFASRLEEGTTRKMSP